ncbi:MAG TPA: aminoacyl-tRNA hydrolase [bacterium]|nr:aminoacyl-tRNA hydrolase [bacterium]
MKLIVGLGNPGDRYRTTRHNAGRNLIEYIARRYGLSFSREKKLSAFAVCFEWEGIPVTFAYPVTFMNVSGEPVKRLANHFEVNFRKDLLVAVDDSAILFGKLRLRSRGSDGGHNGLKSIHQALGSVEYPRLRMGIGGAEMTDRCFAPPLEDYVLSSFNAREKKEMEAFFKRGLEACRLWVTCPIEKAMNIVNESKTQS